MKKDTFGKRLLDFYENLKIQGKLPLKVSSMNPYMNLNKKDHVKKFIDKYYSDNNKRIIILGINPGRFGGGESGINFTDGFALTKYCGIKNTLDNKRELSSMFIYDFINSYGGVDKFYSKFFLSAICPLGFTKNGKNYNYYDDTEFFEFIKLFIVNTLNDQIALGVTRKVAIILGTGNNQKYFELLNRQYKFLDKFFVLEHPRYIMQYKRKSETFYINKFKKVMKTALSEI